MDPLLVFDGDCGFCTRTLGWLRMLDRRRLIETAPYQRPGVAESIGATEADCAASVQWRGADGTRLAGAAAIYAALAVALDTELPTRLYRRTRIVQDRLYTWMAEHRGQLPGIAPWCARYPDDCGGRR